tara:strand:- start:845 stop:1216 length:372 start_codon:yes stop_codon:yes gene_type:complete
MKKLILITLLIFSSTSYAEWTEVGEADGYIFYLDFERIRKHDGYVYYWMMTDYPKPNEYGFLSAQNYKRGDCNLFRFNNLQFVFYTGNMGGGLSDSQEAIEKRWHYPPPGTANEVMLKLACSG